MFACKSMYQYANIRLAMVHVISNFSKILQVLEMEQASLNLIK